MRETQSHWPNLRRRAALAMLVAIAGLLLLAVLPMLPVPSTSDWTKASSGATVQASSRTMFNIEQPVVLSRTPYLELERGRFTLPAAGDGPTDRRLVLEGAVFRLEATRAGAASEPLSPMMQQLATLGIEQVLVRGAMVRLSADANGRLGPLDAELDFSARSQIGLRGVAVFHGDALSFEATFGRDSDAEEQLTGRRKIALTAKGETLGEVRFDGEVSHRSGLAGDLDARLTSPAALMRWLGTPVRQAFALRNVSIAGRARWIDGVFDLQDARVVLDGQKQATGALRLRHRSDRPIIEGTLAFATLDLSRVGPAEETTSTGGALRVFLAALVRDLPAYLDVDADVRLSAATVLLRNGVRGRGAATVTVDRGLLSAELADVEWSGNKARMHVNAGGPSWRPSFNVRGRVDLLQAQDFLTPLFGQALVFGPAALTIDLNGRGEGPTLLPSVMLGKVTVATSAGARTTLDPFKIVERSGERSGARPARENPLVTSAPQTIEGLDLRLLLSERSVNIELGQIRSASGTAKLSGDIDRSSAALNLILSRTPKARGPKGAVDTAEQSFEITGSWGSPTITRLALP